MAHLLEAFSLFAGSYAATLGMGLVCAYLGLFCVLRRIVFTGVALAQLAAAGVAGAFFVADSPTVLAVAPGLADLAGRFGSTLGSLGLALLGALGLQAGPTQKRISPDALVGLAYAASSALAVLLVWHSARGLAELRNILAGEVLLSRGGELTSLWLGLAAVTAVHLLLRRRFLLVSFDPEFARALGLPERGLQLAFLVTLALAVALSLKAGGLLLVFSFLVLPPMTGLLLGRGLPEATALALAVAAGASLVGFLAAIALDLPVAPTVAIVQVLALGLGALGRLRPEAGRAARGLLFGAAAAALVALPVGLLGGPPAPRAAPVVAEQEPGLDDEAAHGHSHGPPAAPRIDVAALSRLLEAGSPAERRTAAEELGRADGRALEPLLRALGDEDGAVVEAAGRALARLCEDPAARSRLEGFARGHDPDLRVRAADAWVSLGDLRGLEAYASLVGDEEVAALERERIAGSLRALDPSAPGEAAEPVEWRRWWTSSRDRARWDPERRAFRMPPRGE